MEGFESAKTPESAEGRRARLEKAADTYRNGYASSIEDVALDTEEASEIMQIVNERNLAEKVHLGFNFAKDTERMVGTENIGSVLESFVNGLSDESKAKLREILAK